ncbi:sugar transferase [bacterium]|nr:sugar transferase [bacterium]
MIANLKHRQKYKITRLIADCITAPITVILAYCLKFKLGWFFQNILSLNLGRIYEQAQIEPYLSELGVITFIWITTFYFVGMYKNFVGIMPEVDEWICIIKGVTLATLELMAFSFVYKSFPGSRFVIAYMWLLGILILLPIRTAIAFAETRRLNRSKTNRSAVVIGNTPAAQDIVEKIVLYPTYGIKYIGSINDGASTDSSYAIRNHLQWIGSIDTIIDILETVRPNIVFFASQSAVDSIKAWCVATNTELSIVVNTGNILTSTAKIIDFDGIPMVHHYTYTPNSRALLIKSLIDKTISLAALVLLAPVFGIIAIVIKYVSPDGPIFYSQDRLTEGGKVFKMIKFRTMIPNAEASSGPVMVNTTSETRYIKYGNFLRKTSLDELPQLVNILKGDMSLVGPRPERPHFYHQFEQAIPHFRLRLLMKGGLTGWAQINGRSALTSRPEFKIKYDLYYINNWSILFDIKIILKTFWLVLGRVEAY